MSASEEKLLMIPGPIELSPKVAKAAAAPCLGHLDPRVIEWFGDSLAKMRKVWLAADDAQPFLLAGSGTLAMEMAAQNLVDPKARVLIVDTGYFSERMAEMFRRRGASVTSLSAAPGEAPSPDDVGRALKEADAAGDRFAAVMITHVDTSTGVLAPVKEYAAQAKAHGALVGVDGICATAAERLEMANWGVDIALTASQKAIGLPPGLALCVVSKAALEAHGKLAVKPPLSVDFASWLPIMQAYEARKPAYFATPATTLVHALSVGLDELLDGASTSADAMEARFAEHRRAAGAMRAAFETMGLGMLPKRPELCAHTLSAVLYPKGVGPELVAAINKRGVIVAGGLHPDLKATYFRIGHMGHSARTSDHLVRAVRAIAGGLADCGSSVDAAKAESALRDALGN